MTLLPAQKQLIESNSKVILIVGGYASGKTEGLLYKILSNENENIAYVSIDNCLSLHIRERITYLNKIFPKNLTLYNYDNFMFSSAVYDIIILDDFGMLPYIESYSKYNQIRAITNKIIISCTPDSDFTLDDNFCYQLSQEKYCKTIRFILTDNYHLPSDYLERIKSVIKEPMYKYYLEGVFTHANK